MMVAADKKRLEGEQTSKHMLAEKGIMTTKPRGFVG